MHNNKKVYCVLWGTLLISQILVRICIGLVLDDKRAVTRKRRMWSEVKRHALNKKGALCKNKINGFIT